MSTVPESRPLNPAIIFESINAYQHSAALAAAIHLELFTYIGAGKRTVSDLAKAAQASERGVRILCDYLTIDGFLTKNGIEYGLSPEAAVFLDKNSPAYFGCAVKFMLDPKITEPYRDLAEVVRQGRTTMPGAGTVSPNNEVWVTFARQMAPMAMPNAQELAARFAGTGPLRVLDVAAGHGLFGIVIAKQNPEAQITAVDWEQVLAVARENAAKFDVTERHTTIAGDAFTTEFAGPYDLVLLTNILHHFSATDCERLIRRAHAALRPGGTCVTLDFVPNEDRVSPPVPAEFALMMLGTTAEGDAYTFAEYERMFRVAGFTRCELVPLQKSPQSLLVSYKA